MANTPKGKRVHAADGSFTVRARQSPGSGSVYAEGDKWRATWVDAAGKQHRIKAKTRREAEKRRAAAIAADQAMHDRPTGADTPVADAARWWLENLAAHRVRNTSLIRYSARVERIAKGPLGAVAVSDLRAEQVAEWVTKLMTDGLGPKTIADVLTVLRQVLDTAVDLGHASANVAKRVPNPRSAPRTARALTVDETRKLLAEARRDDRCGAAVGLLFVAGWRVSEVLGLAWEDVDLDAGTAVVRRAGVYVEGKGVGFGPTKTAGARGVHHISVGVADMLRARRVAQATERLRAGELWTPYQYNGEVVHPVFTDPGGQLIRRQAVTKAIRRMAVTAGIGADRIGTHTGRRTVVTALYAEAGVDLADIARHVGHASTSTTAGYVRDLGRRPQQTAETAARLLDAQ